MAGGNAGRRKLHDAAVVKLQDLYHHFCIFQKAANTVAAEVDDLNEDEESSETNAWRSRLSTALEKHLVKTLGSQVVDVLLRTEANLHGLKLDESEQKYKDADFEAIWSSALSAQKRNDILSQIPPSHAKIFRSLMVQKDPALFAADLEEAAPTFDVQLKGADSKTERNLTFNIRRGLMAQLQTESRPALVLHYTTLILHSKVSNTVLHAPSRSIPDVVESLEGKLAGDAWNTLSSYCKSVQAYANKQKQQAGEEEEWTYLEDDGRSIEDLKDGLEKAMEVHTRARTHARTKYSARNSLTCTQRKIHAFSNTSPSYAHAHAITVRTSEKTLTTITRARILLDWESFGLKTSSYCECRLSESMD